MSAIRPMCVVTKGAPSAIASSTVVGHGSGHFDGSTAASACQKPKTTLEWSHFCSARAPAGKG
jgi:hypothetical protein